MKIEYTNKQPTKNPTLRELKPGEAFRPTNSPNIFMRCDHDGESRLLSNYAPDIWESITVTGQEPFEDVDVFRENHDYDELIVCVHLATGSITLFYQGIEVERLNCKLLVEEGE